MSIDTRLATYGTLAPGRPNHHQLAPLSGEWLDGYVTGCLVQRGWGAKLGYPAMVPDPDGEPIAVSLFLSDQLPLHWLRLDAFEGKEYRRAAIDVHTERGTFEAWIYLDRAP